MEMPQNYQSIADMAGRNGSWKKFLINLAGTTNGAHQPIVKNLKDAGHYEVNNVLDADYLLVFCPIASRVGTDISEALKQIRDDKPTILVVMHHTFNRNTIVAESKRQVTNPNVCLTVDCLFFEHKLLDCPLNDISRREIETFLQIPTSVDAGFSNIFKRLRDNPYCRWVIVFVVVGSILVIGLAVGLTNRK
ncbi:uncharacterized protein PAE49_002286 isoform 2-T2 [Odontesthes bonariensis]